MGVCPYPNLMTKNSFLAAFLMLFFTPVAMADPNLNCEVYAEEAMAEIQDAMFLQCGFTGDSWTPDYNAHFNWCKSDGVSIVDVSGQDQVRKAQILSCRQTMAQTPGPRACSFFAENMVANAQTGSAWNCGFSGGRFTTDAQAHFTWCMSGATADQIVTELRLSEDAVAACKATPGKVNPDTLKAPGSPLPVDTTCSRYADKMLALATANQESNCGYTDSMFSTDYQGHQNWCENQTSKTIMLATLAAAHKQIAVCQLVN